MLVQVQSVLNENTNTKRSRSKDSTGEGDIYAGKMRNTESNSRRGERERKGPICGGGRGPRSSKTNGSRGK